MGRPATKYNHLLGEFRISKIERAKRGEPEVEITFALDANGILNVTAQDKKTKAKAEITIANACKGLSPDEISRMVEEAERFAKEDAEVLRKMDLKEETLEWLDEVDLSKCPLQTLEARLKEVEA